jgi:hypothetical protein
LGTNGVQISPAHDAGSGGTTGRNVKEELMNLSWISIFGGGLATAATLAVGVNLTGLSGAFAPTLSPEPTTVYVEQPIVEVAAPSLGAPATLPPLVIAVLPAPSDGSPVVPTAGSATGSSGVGSGDVITPPPPATDDESGEGSGGESEEHDDGGESEGSGD